MRFSVLLLFVLGTGANSALADGLIQRSGPFFFRYRSDDKLPPYQERKARGFRVRLPDNLSDEFAMDEIVSEVARGLERIELHFGALEDAIDIYICQGVYVLNDNKWEPLWGVRRDHHGRRCIFMDHRAFPGGYVAHELLHARFRELERKQRWSKRVWWFEEGLCEFIQTEDGFRQDHVDWLDRFGVLPYDQIVRRPKFSQDEWRVRATSWALVYYMAEVQNKSLLEIARTAHIPHPEAAFEEILAKRQAESP